jgi:hypothetical protein
MFIYPVRNYTTLDLLNTPHDIKSSLQRKPHQELIPSPQAHQSLKIHLPEKQAIVLDGYLILCLLIRQLSFLAVSVQIIYTGDTANIPMVAWAYHFFFSRAFIARARRRVSLADYRGNVVLDTLVRPTYVAELWQRSFGADCSNWIATK